MSVLEEIRVGWYLDAGQPYGSWTARRIRGLIRTKGVSYAAVAAGDSLGGLGEVGCVVLHPGLEFVTQEGEPKGGLNNGSVVLKLEYRDIGILLTGDIEHETDLSLIRWAGACVPTS